METKIHVFAFHCGIRNLLHREEIPKNYVVMQREEVDGKDSKERERKRRRGIKKEKHRKRRCKGAGEREMRKGSWVIQKGGDEMTLYDD